MSLLVVGSIAFDSVETPFGKAEEAIGGSAMFFSTSASYFTKIALVAVVGDDFPESELEFLRSKAVDCEGVHRVAGKTFRWCGRYGFDLNEAITLDTQLNVFGDFHPNLPPRYRDMKRVFLANIDPELQLEVLEQVREPEFVACDTMNFWIDGKRPELERTLRRVDMVIINEAEARKLAGEANIVKAAQAIQSMGPKYLVIKRGEYGALLFTPEDVFYAPAYPLEAVYDPTGAGDSFAGGLLGYLTSRQRITPAELRQATIVGCVMASFCVEQFSLDALRSLDRATIARRFERFRRLVSFEDLDLL
jgi:sugar/nucleoside kinase (ribokinase family)